VEALTRDELIRLLGAAKKERERDWLMLLIAFWHGLRETEVVGGWLTKRKNGKTEKIWYPGLTKASFSDGYITVQRLKGSRRTTQPLMAHSDPLLDERAAVPAFLATVPDNDGGRLFPMSRSSSGAWCSATPRRPSCHRKSATLTPSSIRSQCPWWKIKSASALSNAYLGHESGASTMEYLKASQEQAAAALARAEQHRVNSTGRGARYG
jgi:integrase